MYELPCALALATGMRPGEILSLRWSDLSSDLSSVQVVRTLQPTQDRLIFEEPKTARSRRSVLLPAFVRPFLERQRDEQVRRRRVTAETSPSMTDIFGAHAKGLARRGRRGARLLFSRR